MKIAKSFISYVCAMSFLFILIGVFLPILEISTKMTYEKYSYTLNALSFAPQIAVALLVFGILGVSFLFEKSKYFSYICLLICFILYIALINTLKSNIEVSSMPPEKSLVEEFAPSYTFIIFTTIFSALVTASCMLIAFMEQLNKSKKPGENSLMPSEVHKAKLQNIDLLAKKLALLDELHEKGILTEAELAEKRKSIIDNIKP